MKEIKINVPLELRQTVLYPTANGMTSRVEAEFEDVEVRIFGLQKDVDAFLTLNEQKTGIDDGPSLPETWAELQEWRSAAKLFDVGSPKELASITDVSFGEMIDRKFRVQLREATGHETIAGVVELIKSLLERCQKTSLPVFGSTPSTGEVVFAISQSGLDQMNNRAAHAEKIAEQRGREISEWVSRSGVSSPDELVEKFRVTEDAWKEATGATDTHAAYKKITDLESKLLSYASEIDALRKIPNGNKTSVEREKQFADDENNRRVAAERELAKMKTELDSKRRECQTLKESIIEKSSEVRLFAVRAETAERCVQGIDDVLFSFTKVRYSQDKLAEKIGSLLSEASDKIKGLEEFKRGFEHRGQVLDKIEKALGRDFAHESLSEHVADLKRAYDKLDPGPLTPEDREKEAKEIGEIISSHLRDSGICSAAEALAARYAYLSSSWTKAMQAREVLGAKTGESVVDAANRVRTSDHEKELHDVKVVMNIIRDAFIRKMPQTNGELACNTWTEIGNKIAALVESAIFPLPKPQRADVGQRWAKIHTITMRTDDGTIYTNNVSPAIGRATAMTHGGDSWIYLGT